MPENRACSAQSDMETLQRLFGRRGAADRVRASCAQRHETAVSARQWRAPSLHQFGAQLVERVAHIGALDRSVDGGMTHRQLGDLAILPGRRGPAAKHAAAAVRGEPRPVDGSVQSGWARRSVRMKLRSPGR